MKESIGMTALINIILVFLVLVFMFLAGTISYNKAFKVNTKIIRALEIYEGYNANSKREIDNVLGSIAYRLGDSSSCPLKRNGGDLVISATDKEKFLYCIYYFDNDGDKCHYSYGVVTYLEINFPIIADVLKVPVYSKTRRIYRFDFEKGTNGVCSVYEEI